MVVCFVFIILFLWIFECWVVLRLDRADLVVSLCILSSEELFIDLNFDFRF